MADGNHIASENGGWIAAFVTGCFALLQALVYRRKKKPEPEPINGSRAAILDRLSRSEQNYRDAAADNQRLDSDLQDLVRDFRRHTQATEEWQRLISSQISELRKLAD